MNVARLLQDSPSEDRPRRQELRVIQDREREREDGREREHERELAKERDRDRDREREREWVRNREWDRDRERLQRERSSLSSTSSTPVHLPAQRPYSPPGNVLPPRSHVHPYDNKPHPPPPSRTASISNQGPNHAYTHSPVSENVHARSYSQGSHPASSSHSHSPPAPLFLSPLTAPREGAAAGPVPGATLGTEYSAEYTHRTKNSSSQHGQANAPPPPMLSRREERERDYRQRAHSLTGSTRSRTPPYGDYRDTGRISPTASRLGSRQHSPAQGSYSVVPPSPSLSQQQFSPPLPSSLNNSSNSSSLPRMHPNQGPPLTRRPPPPPSSSSLPPPPSTSLNRSHDNSGGPTNSAMGRFDERPYLGRAPSSSSSSAMSAGRERNLKEDLEREREVYDRERRERERERERGRGFGHSSRSRSASASAGIHSSAHVDRLNERERGYTEQQRMKDMDAIRAAAETRMQGQPRDARERDAPRHHHHHHHHHPVSHSHSHPHSSQNAHSHQQQNSQQHLQQQHPSLQQPLPHIPGTPYTYAHTGKPRISRSGVLKLAPPGVTVPNNVPPSSSDLIFAGAPGVVMRQETLSLAPSHPSGALQLRQEQQQSQHQQQGPPGSGPQGPYPNDYIPIDARQRSSPNLHLQTEMHAEGAHAYGDGPQSYSDGPHPAQQHPPQSGKHKSYSVVPTGPGVPPSSGVPLPPGGLHASMMQQQQQHHYGQMPPPHQTHNSHPHQQSLPLPPQSRPSSSTNGMPGQGPPPAHLQTNPYRHMPSGMPPQNYAPPSVHYNEVPPPPVPMALQPMPPSTPPMHEPTPAEAPLHIGTFIYPRTPFPYFFSARADSERRGSNVSPGYSKKFGRREADFVVEHEELPTHVTILVPSGHLPSSLPTDGKPRIWGGAPLSVPNPWTPYVNFVTRSHSMIARRIYTDDSDIVLCALHSGRVSWTGIKCARAAGLDLSVKLAVYRDVGRYVGAPSAFADGSVVNGTPDVDVGLKRLIDPKGLTVAFDNGDAENTSWLTSPSASWESGHDGSGFEPISTEWLPRGSTRKLGLRGRSQRLSEYTERRRVVMKEVPPDNLLATTKLHTGVLGKRTMSLMELSTNSSYEMENETEDDIYSTRTVVFAKHHESELTYFKYDRATVPSVIFSSLPRSRIPSERPRGRRKRLKVANRYGDALFSETGTEGRRSPSPRLSDRENTPKGFILENSKVCYLFASRDSSDGTDDDKENRLSPVDESIAVTRTGRSYDVYSLPFSPPNSPPVELKQQPVVNGNGTRKPDITSPLTPNSDRGESASPHGTEEHKDAGDKRDALVVDDTTSKGSKEAVSMLTPPATTETEHPSLPLLNDKDKGEGTKTPQVLYRGLTSRNVVPFDKGISVVGVERTSMDRSDMERLIYIDRWRFATSRDLARLKNYKTRVDAGNDLVVAVS